MRLRHALVSACGALALIAALGTPAHAATGHFDYKYIGLNGHQRSGTLTDPEDIVCITIPEVADPDSSHPAFAPHNRTDMYAMVYTGEDCTGDSWTLKPHGRPATDRLELRSVAFFTK
ncbi:hypothetical protein [Streptomyces sp. NBC_00083]|uniref:hypothetical protein n=1 Tax=Streptomyces sp. NBC_00083 TaxID=2975647 RepID=UPI00224ED389|nr:hypothetical protein [Streptomyces sp. NBC_00083]MCX5386814.1 hypothetical protein [Streptomyces sp. NBC_00083]